MRPFGFQLIIAQARTANKAALQKHRYDESEICEPSLGRHIYFKYIEDFYDLVPTRLYRLYVWGLHGCRMILTVRSRGVGQYWKTARFPGAIARQINVLLIDTLSRPRIHDRRVVYH